VFKKILLAYDGSEPARKAFERCLEMTRCFGAQLTIVSVVRAPEFAEDVETEAVIENARSHFQSELGKLRAQASSAGTSPPPAVHIRVGHPAEQIIAAAEEWDADLIVTGHRGRGLFERWLLGSVSRVVIAYARCAVLVVR
jgi:nucleotide-binding universal stress UspA family protein